ncbi:MAG: hypothetical protein ACR2QC_07770 [Gammaproteobacteria bacterium]
MISFATEMLDWCLGQRMNAVNLLMKTLFKNECWIVMALSEEEKAWEARGNLSRMQLAEVAEYVLDVATEDSSDDEPGETVMH